jgi:hypothetical protein
LPNVRWFEEEGVEASSVTAISLENAAIDLSRQTEISRSTDFGAGRTTIGDKSRIASGSAIASSAHASIVRRWDGEDRDNEAIAGSGSSGD